MILTSILSVPALAVLQEATLREASASALQDVAVHASLHPAETTFFWELPDVQALPDAYATSPLWRIVTDPELAEAIRAVSRGQVDLEEVLTMARQQVTLDNLPPHLLEMGMGDAIEGLRSASLSLCVPADLEQRVEPLAMLFGTMARIEMLGSEVEGYAFLGDGTYPASLDALDVAAELRIDSWGAPFTYEVTDDGYRITSTGADGAEGGDGIAMDISHPDPDGSVEESLAGLVGAVLVDSFGLQAVLSFDDETTAESLFDSARMASEGRPVRPETLAGPRGEELHVLVMSEQIGPNLELDMWLTQHDRHLILGGGGLNGLDGFGARAAGGFTSGLAAKPAFSNGAAKLPEARGTTVIRAFHERPWWEPMQVIAEHAVGVATPLIGLDEDAIFGPAELEQLRGQLEAMETLGAWIAPPGSSRVDLADGYFEKHRFVPADARPEPRWFGIDEIDPAIFELVPADAGMVFSAPIDAAHLAGGVESLVTSMLGRPELRGALAAVEQDAGLSLAEDLLAHVDRQMVASIGAVRGIGLPTVLAHGKLRDVQAFEAALGRVLGATAERWADTVKYKDKPYRKMPLYQLEVKLPQPETDPTADLPPEMAQLAELMQGFGNELEVAIGIADDTLVVGMKSLHVKKELRRLTGDSSRRRDDEEEEEPAVHPLASGAVALPDGAHQVTYVDWGGYFAGLYNMGKAFGGLAAGFSDEELPVDLAALPEAELITRHLVPTVSTTAHGEHGSLTHTVSSFGPEMLLMPVAAGVGGAVVMPNMMAADQDFGPTEWEEGDWDVGEWEELEAVPVPPAPPSPEESQAETRDALMRLRTVLEVYRYTQGDRYPEALAALTEATGDFPDGYLDGDPVPSDGWGRTLVYAATDEGRSYRLYSVGADGNDDGGTGDDILVP